MCDGDITSSHLEKINLPDQSYFNLDHNQIFDILFHEIGSCWMEGEMLLPGDNPDVKSAQEGFLL